MAESINIELVTPSEMLFTDTADMVVVPGSEGVFWSFAKTCSHTR